MAAHKLPHPAHNSSQTLEQSIEQRRSCREYSSLAVTLQQLSQLLWSAQGITGENGQKSAPSAGAQYPLQIYVVAGKVEDLPVGSYQYQAHSRELECIAEDDLRETLGAAALDQQPWVNEAALVLVLTANFTAMQNHFQEQPPQGKRGERYIYLESGAIAQNLHLQACSLGLGAVLVGGFDDDKVIQALNLPDDIKPTALMCIGAKK